MSPQPEASTRSHHLCIVEDDGGLRGLLRDYFEKHGMAVTPLGSAEALMAHLGQTGPANNTTHGPPDLILMDVGLPGMSGLQACQRLRQARQQVPIIMMTGSNDEIDRVVGLEIGADDYLGKPFSSRELLARVRAVLRRVVPAAPSQPLGSGAAVRIGEHQFVPASRSLYRGQQVQVLNPVEFALLAELTRQPQVPVSRLQLLAAAHPAGEPALPRAVDAAIMRLRRVVEPDPAQPRYIQTVRFHGYMFVPHTEAPAPVA